MSEPISRRRFIRDTTIAAGIAVVADPGWVLPAGTAVADATPKEVPSRGIHAAVVDHEDGSPVRWGRLGDDVTMELGATSILIGVPTVMYETDGVLTLDEFQRGIGHHEIVRDLGEPALMRLRDEISYRTVLQPSVDDQF